MLSPCNSWRSGGSAAIHTHHIPLRIADIKGEDGICSGFYGFHGAILHAVIAEDNDLARGFGDSLDFAEGAENTIFVAPMSFYTFTLPE
jgi:hypothetical protein